MSTKLKEFPKIPESMAASPEVEWYSDVEEPEYVQAGTLLLPRFFRLHIAHTDSPTWAATLFFKVSESGDIAFRRFTAGGVEVHEALNLISKVHPIEDWSRIAVAGLVLDELHESVGLPVDAARKDARARIELAGAASIPLEDTGDPLDIDRDRTAEIVRESQRMSVKRVRVTDDHLRAVVVVYKVAAESGLGPTLAVADHFDTSHSTAARWVGMARKRGLLPPTEPGKGKA